MTSSVITIVRDNHNREMPTMSRKEAMMVIVYDRLKRIGQVQGDSARDIALKLGFSEGFQLVTDALGSLVHCGRAVYMKPDPEKVRHDEAEWLHCYQAR